MKIATREQVREIDRRAIEDYKIPGLVLMENAGRSVAELISIHYPRAGKIAIFCGIGNNGGDGFVIARHLITRGMKVTTFICGDDKKYKGDSLANYISLQKIEAEIIRLSGKLPGKFDFDLTVDCIFGTGLDRDVKGSYKDLIEFINSSDIPVISVDIPSGLDANTARPLGCSIKADCTATFAVPKIGNVIYPGAEYCGNLYLSGITTPQVLENDIKIEILDARAIKTLFKKRSQDTHKGTYGHLFILAGSPGKTGACVLSATGSQRVGTGLVTAGVAESLNPVVEEKLTETMSEPITQTKDGLLGNVSLKRALGILDDKKSALAIGPGISTSRQTEKFLFDLLGNCHVPMVIDADAITLIAKKPEFLKKLKAPAILTPHPGEMARLIAKSSKEVQNDRIGTTRDFATKYGIYIVLKGARTLIGTPEGKIYINPTGNPGMAAGGMGDVLTGIIGGLLAQGYNAENSCKIGVFIHGLAGDMAAEHIADSGFLAGELADYIPVAIKDIKNDKVKEYIKRVY